MYELVIEGASPSEDEEGVKIGMQDGGEEALSDGEKGDAQGEEKIERRELVLANECRLHPGTK